MPLSGGPDDPDDPDPEPDPETETKTHPKEPTESLPKIEISVARSVSVSKGKGKKQTLVPVGGRRQDALDPDERLVDVERKAKTPRVMDGQYGHRHGNSQDVEIDSV